MSIISANNIIVSGDHIFVESLIQWPDYARIHSIIAHR